MQKLADFKLPQFFNYPPYFTYSISSSSFLFFFSYPTLSLKCLEDYELKKSLFLFLKFAACEGHS